MARPRTQAKTKPAATSSAKSKAAASNSAATTQVTCPECGRSFSRPASLGAHRRRAHGVAGATSAKNARKTSQRRQPRRQSTVAGATASSTGDGSRSGAARAGASVNRDALLQQLFPSGIPARESVITRLNSWLDEAEKLASLK